MLRSNNIYIQRLRKNGTAISVRLVQAAAKGYHLLSHDHTVLVEYVSHARLAHLLLKRMGYVKRKGSTKPNSKLLRASSKVQFFPSKGRSWNFQLLIRIYHKRRNIGGH